MRAQQDWDRWVAGMPPHIVLAVQDQMHEEHTQRFGPYVPWPWRCPSDPLPSTCPKCGRATVLRAWNTNPDYVLGHHRFYELTCFGPWYSRWLYAWLHRNGWPAAGHWTFPVDAEDL